MWGFSDECLTPGCARPAAASLKRGLCLLCYSRAKKLVEDGTTTWDEIVELGLALPNDGEGADPFTKAFDGAKKKQRLGTIVRAENEAKGANRASDE